MNLVDEKTIHQTFSQLSRINQVKITWEIFRRQAQILFSKKFIWAMLVLLIFWGVVYTINYQQESYERLTQEDILWPILWPLCGLALFLNMQLISSEKENRTLEVLFTTAGSRYKVWLIRMATLNLIILLISIFLSGLAFFTISDIALLATGLHAFIPAFVVGGMTLYFSVRFRSGLAAGMVSAGILFLTMMFYGALEGTKYVLFFNPYDIPRQLDPQTWYLWMWQNRIGLICLGFLLQFFALRGLEKRERLLR